MDFTKRVLSYLILSTKKIKFFLPFCSVFPLFVVLFFLNEKQSHLKALYRQIRPLKQTAALLKENQLQQQKKWETLQQSNPLYLSQSVERLSLLSRERDRVEILSKHYPENPFLQERLSFFQEEKNQIRFIPLIKRPGHYFLETELKLQNTVQMNEDDLRKFLFALEGEIKEKPSLMIKHFELTKKKEKGEEFVYTIEAELIQRTP